MKQSYSTPLADKSLTAVLAAAPAPVEPYVGVYEGDLVDGKRHGQGTLRGDAVTYVGSWQNDLAHGFGTATFASGTVYEGHWDKQQFHGQGKMTESAAAGGRVREGLFQHSYLVEGRATYKSGAKYEGQWQRDKYHGAGKLTNADGSVLEGTFKFGKIHNGKGKMIINPKDPKRRVEIECTWVDGKEHGEGQRTGPRSKYVGKWEGGFKTGKGEFLFDSGEVLKGEFQRGHIVSGEGTLKTASGGSVSGKWVDGVLQERQAREAGK
jgi:hypothetical protein